MLKPHSCSEIKWNFSTYCECTHYIDWKEIFIVTSSVIALLLKLPAFFSMLQKLAEIISNEIDKLQKNQLIKKMDQAVITAQTAKDTSDLDAMFDSRKN